jgi:hypothetical protein
MCQSYLPDSEFGGVEACLTCKGCCICHAKMNRRDLVLIYYGVSVVQPTR